MIVLLTLMCQMAIAADWEPARWPPPEPGVYTGPPETPQEQGLLNRMYHWYHERISSRDGARCPYYPTCSAYALLAYRTHGAIVGTMLVADRFLREYPWMHKFRHYPIVTPHGVPRFYDPVPPRSRKSNQDEP